METKKFVGMKSYIGVMVDDPNNEMEAIEAAIIAMTENPKGRLWEVLDEDPDEASSTVKFDPQSAADYIEKYIVGLLDDGTVPDRVMLRLDALVSYAELAAKDED